MDDLFNPIKEKYITAGVNTKIPVEYQLRMFGMIEAWRQTGVLDYLQVFNLSVSKNEAGNRIQIIEHRQEVPDRSEVVQFHITDTGVTEKIFVIDDGAQYFTMLLSAEY